MLNVWRSSLGGRLAFLAMLVFAVSVPLFWFLFSAYTSRISQDVVDTRLLEFAEQVRGYHASQLTISPEQTEGSDIVVSESGLGGPDIEWVWQITVDGAISRKSELLRLVDATIAPTRVNAEKAFVFINRQTPLGPMRIAERIIEQPSAQVGGRISKTHFLVGLSETRYAAYVDDHAKRLEDLAILGVIVMSVVIFAMLTVIVLAVQHQLAGIKNALSAYEQGDSEGIEGRFPTEIQSVIDLMNDLLRRNQKLIERTRKYVSKIAHDINHPLAILRNGLKGDVDTALLNRQVARMTGLVDRYASLARAIGPEGESRNKTDITVSIRDTAESFSILYRRNPLTINCEVAENLTFVIPQHDLEAVVSNLVSNAHKYAETVILISTKLEAGDLEITVGDDGPGIPEDQMDTVLNWGKRLDESPPGTGFGLSIVTDILDLYNGSISLSTSPLGGFEATVRFPGPENRRPRY